MNRTAHTFSALVCVAAVGAGTAAVAANIGAGSASALKPTVAVSEAVMANESAARADAASLPTELSLPAGSTQSSIEPPGDDSLLAHPGFGPPPTPNVVDIHMWWLVPGPPDQVLAYIDAHLPTGSAKSGSAASVAGPGAPSNYSQAFAWPPIANVLAVRWLVVQVVQLTDGSTGLRADAQVVWVTPRPAAERIPSGARLIRVSVYSTIKKNQPKQRPFTVTSASTIASVVGLLNALPAAQPGRTSCPADFGVRVRLALYVRHRASPSAVADIDPQGCEEVQLMIGGRRQASLEGAASGSRTSQGSSLIDRVDHLLGVSINTTPR